MGSIAAPKSALRKDRTLTITYFDTPTCPTRPENAIAMPAQARVPVRPSVRPVLAVTGLAREARLAEGPGVITIRAGGDTARLRAMLGAHIVPNCRAVISVGIAGGLDPDLVPGDVIVATGIATPDRRHSASLDVARRLAAQLSAHPKRVVLADLAGVDAAVMCPIAKRDLRRATGAIAVDMESHIAADFAARYGLPFAAVRVICDPAHRALPALIATALHPNGEVNFSSLLGGLMRRPLQLVAMTRLARDAAEGFRALRNCRDLLGYGFGIPHAGEV
jgi:hopanoid-associated phosphorylase